MSSDSENSSKFPSVFCPISEQSSKRLQARLAVVMLSKTCLQPLWVAWVDNSSPIWRHLKLVVSLFFGG